MPPTTRTHSCLEVVAAMPKALALIYVHVMPFILRFEGRDAQGVTGHQSPASRLEVRNGGRDGTSVTCSSHICIYESKKIFLRLECAESDSIIRSEGFSIITVAGPGQALSTQYSVLGMYSFSSSLFIIFT